MRKYEAVLVFHPNLSKEALEEEVKKIETFFQEQNVASLESIDWGRKELPHLASRQSHGVYRAFYVTSEDYSLPSKLAAVLRINDQVLKFQTVVMTDRRRKVKGAGKQSTGEAAAA